jgi:glycylpeptide N-tetradecanoyltransferase
MYKDWLVSVVREDKIKNKKKIIGFISAIPTKLCINNTEIKMAKVCFLCVKKNLEISV